MSLELNITRTAGADLSAAGQYRFVEQTNTGAITICNSAGEKALGVLVNNPASGQAATVAVGGLVEIEAGATIAPGDLLATTAAGKAAVATNGQVILGEALSGGGDGAIVSMLFQPMAYSGSIVVTQDSQLQTASVTITAAQVKALNTTPITLIAAPGEGYALALDSAVLFLDYESAAYDEIAAGEDLNIRYTDGSGQLVATIETDPFLTATADALRYVQPATTAAITPVENAALVLYMATGNIATGDSPLKIKLYYRVIPAAL
jgi:hypothetical protein